MAISDYTRLMLDVSSKYKDMSIVKKARIVKTFAAWCILFGVFLKYLNGLNYINMPTFPLLPEPIRYIGKSNFLCVIFLYCVIVSSFKIIESKVRPTLFRRLKDRSATLKKVLFAKYVFDYFFSIYLLVYAVNYLVNYANGKYDKDLRIACISAVYILVISLERDYYKHCNIMEKLDIRYTNYCDSKGARIPEESQVFYGGKLYKIERDDDGKWVLYDKSKRLIHHHVTLEEAVADNSGNLMICQEY